MLTYDMQKRGDNPLYVHLYQCIKDDLTAGRLKAGEKLPSKRSLAEHLKISVITVQKAYELLQRDGFIETVQGKGTFISGASRDFILEERLRRIEEHLDAAAQAAREADIPLDKLTDILRLFYEQEDQNI